jgi:hypothetical protein
LEVTLIHPGDPATSQEAAKQFAKGKVTDCGWYA